MGPFHTDPGNFPSGLWNEGLTVLSAKVVHPDPAPFPWSSLPLVATGSSGLHLRCMVLTDFVHAA